MKLNLTVSDSIKVTDGVYRVELSHPKMEGTLWFYHGETNKENILESFQSNIVEDLTEIITAVQSLRK